MKGKKNLATTNIEDRLRQIEGFITLSGRKRLCILRDFHLQKGDPVQIDDSPENNYKMTGGLLVVRKRYCPGVYGEIVSEPIWRELPKDAISHDPPCHLYEEKIPDWETCLRKKYYKTAIVEIAGVEYFLEGPPRDKHPPGVIVPAGSLLLSDMPVL